MPGTNPGTTGLVSWWPLNEASGQRNDSHGSNTLVDNATVLSAAGVVGNAADFERDNSEWLSVADNATLQTGDIDFTLGAWVKLESLENMGFLNKYNPSPGEREYVIGHNVSGTPLDFVFFVSPDGTATTSLRHNTSAVIGVWYFIVCWHDSVNNLIGIEINGANPVTAAHTTGVYTGSGKPFELGRLFTTAGWSADALIDETFFYKRLLTADERTWLYNAGAGRAYSELAAGLAVPMMLASDQFAGGISL